MATGIRNTDPDQIRDTLVEIGVFDGNTAPYVSVEEEQLSEIKETIRSEYEEDADEMLEGILAIEDLWDAATDGVEDDDVLIENESLIGFSFADNTIKRVTPARLCTINEETYLVVGGHRVRVTQKGKELSVGRLAANMAEDYEKVEKATSGDPITFHFIRFQDQNSKDCFDVAVYVKQDMDPEAVKPYLKAGDSLAQILSAPGGGGAMRLADYLGEDVKTPWEAKVVSLNARESDSKFAHEGMSYSVTLEDGVTVYLRGEAEKQAHKRRSKIEKDLAQKPGSWELRVADITHRDDGKTVMKVNLVNAAIAGAFKNSLAAADAKTKGELPAAAEEEAAEEAPKAAPARRRNAFSKAKAA